MAGAYEWWLEKGYDNSWTYYASIWSSNGWIEYEWRGSYGLYLWPATLLAAFRIYGAEGQAGLNAKPWAEDQIRMIDARGLNIDEAKARAERHRVQEDMRSCFNQTGTNCISSISDEAWGSVIP